MDKQLITKDRYEGLDPQIVDALKNRLTIKGKLTKSNNEIVDGYIMDYFPAIGYLGVENNSNYSINYKHFEPEYKEEIDFSKLPVDTLCRVTDFNAEYLRYFARYSHNTPHFWIEGRTSETALNEKDTTTWSKVVEIIEYPKW